MRVVVVTLPIPFVAGRDKELNRNTIDWNDSSDRKWLNNHMHWAMKNGHVITMHPESN